MLRRLSLICIFALLPLTACAAGGHDASAPTRYKRVVLISVDGLRADLVGEMPFLDGLRRRGSWTFKAETPLPSITVVSHAAMLTGATPEVNGVTGFEPEGEAAEEKWRPLKVATILEAVQSQHELTAALIQKKKLYGIVPIEAANFFGWSQGLQQIVDASNVEIGREPIRQLPVGTFVFIHLKDVDGAGHKYGWLSKEQKEAAGRVDDALEEIYDTILESQKSYKIPTLVIITADHGGHGMMHGTAADTDRLVPWIAIGPGIHRNNQLRGTVRLIDIAPTALRALGMDPKELLPKAQGRVLEEIFRP